MIAGSPSNEIKFGPSSLISKVDIKIGSVDMFISSNHSPLVSDTDAGFDINSVIISSPDFGNSCPKMEESPANNIRLIAVDLIGYNFFFMYNVLVRQ